MINQIGQMYGWERQLRLSRAKRALRQAHRRAHSRMVVERCYRALHLLRPRYLPQSPMGQDITYALNQWATLERFLEHGEVEIDNNLVENAIRPTAIGKKNWLFFGSEEAGQRSAVIYTLVENCRAPQSRTLYLSQRRAGAPAHHHQPGSRPTDAAQLEESPPAPSQVGRLIFPSASGKSAKVSRIPDLQLGDPPSPLTLKLNEVSTEG